MPILVRKAQTRADQPATRAVSLAQAAIDLLHAAAGVTPDDPDATVVERNSWQPDFWLMQRGWQALADLGAGDEAMAVAALLELRHPLAPPRRCTVWRDRRSVSALKQLAAQELDRLPSSSLARLSCRIRSGRPSGCSTRAPRPRSGTIPPLCAWKGWTNPRVWGKALANGEWRSLLAQTISRVGLSPLTAI